MRGPTSTTEPLKEIVILHNTCVACICCVLTADAFEDFFIFKLHTMYAFQQLLNKKLSKQSKNNVE